MGTSINQQSPKTLNWQAVHAAYRNQDVPVARVTSELWRAATNQKQGDLASLLSAPIVAKVGQLAARAKNSLELSRAAAIEIVRTKSSSLASDIARRAAIQCMAAPDRVAAYHQRLFAEATSYLISRDFAGFVGSGRVRAVNESLEFKTAVTNHVAGVVSEIGKPSSLAARGWEKHVQNVISALQGKIK